MRAGRRGTGHAWRRRGEERSKSGVHSESDFSSNVPLGARPPWRVLTLFERRLRTGRCSPNRSSSHPARRACLARVPHRRTARDPAGWSAHTMRSAASRHRQAGACGFGPGWRTAGSRWTRGAPSPRVDGPPHVVGVIGDVGSKACYVFWRVERFCRVPAVRARRSPQIPLPGSTGSCGILLAASGGSASIRQPAPWFLQPTLG